jgi:hypothetical protein
MNFHQIDLSRVRVGVGLNTRGSCDPVLSPTITHFGGILGV